VVLLVCLGLPNGNSHMSTIFFIAALTTSKVKLTYFPVAARGELARLYAAAGELDITDDTDVVLGGDYKTSTPFGFLPVLDDPEAGLMRLQESLAVERYVASIAPKFKGLTPAQRAVDDQYACVKEDLMAVEACMTNASFARACVPPKMDFYLSILETLVPANGFVNGLEFPTGADLATLLIAEAGFPWGRAMRLANYTTWRTRFPKVHALAKRTAEVPAVASYLAASRTFYARRDPEPSELETSAEAHSSELPPIPSWTHSVGATIATIGVALAAAAGLACYCQRDAIFRWLGDVVDDGSARARDYKTHS